MLTDAPSSLAGQLTVVTGAAGAVGSATVKAIVEVGGEVLALDSDGGGLRHSFDSEAVSTATVDVSNELEWARIASLIADRWGRLDGLVTCAAILHPQDGDVEAITRQAWDRTYAVNVTGAILASRVAIPLMRERGRGAIVHVSSVVARRGSATPQVAYTSSKGAISSLTRELAVAYASAGIRVNSVAPGLLETPLTADLVSKPQELARRLAHIPMARRGHPREVGAAVAWLLSDAAAYVTGAELVVDGGLSAAFVTGHELW